MTTWRLPQDSLEWVGPLTVTDAGTPVTTFQVALRLRGAKVNAVDWRTPDTLTSQKGIIVGPGPGSGVGQLDRGCYRILVKYTSSPEAPIIDRAGVVYIV